MRLRARQVAEREFDVELQIDRTLQLYAEARAHVTERPHRRG